MYCKYCKQVSENEICNKCKRNIATFLSFIIIGSGQIYNKEIKKGIIFFILAVIFTTTPLIVLVPILWIYNIYDAYKFRHTTKIKPLIPELTAIGNDIVSVKSVTDQQIESLKKYDKKLLVNLYNDIYSKLSIKELEEGDIELLLKIQKELNLSNEDIRFNELIRPHVYEIMITKKGTLPNIKHQIYGIQPILKKDEVIHFADNAILKELKSSNIYSGYSVRMFKGIYSRMSFPIKMSTLVDVSKGIFFITNQRIFLHPTSGQKAFSIPLNKILSYTCYNDGIIIYKEGKEKGYLIAMNSGSSKTSGLCISHLLSQINKEE